MSFLLLEFLDSLSRNILKRAGSTVQEEGFLEYINNVLASGLVSNLFSRDEQAEVVTELLPIMKRECPRIPPTPENAMAWFLERVKANLHVVLCFSPVGEKFRSRALKFPGLTSGRTTKK